MAIDWDRVRGARYADETPPPDWPSQVKPISINGLQLFGVHAGNGTVYWDGKQIEVVRRLAWPERTLAVIATVSALLAALHPFGETFHWW
ncbi:hypothetical protein [Georhizobium sp. MAB10]|uniref:hypothetical protein n=1 Tax=Georhizobium sp. MAB10 TaxID=3028319 RepID=UPI003855AB9C